MARLFTIFVALLTFAHATFGCCMHHAHAAEMGNGHRDGHEAGQEVCTVDHDHSATAIEAVCPICQRNHSHDESHPCQEGHCNFARTEAKGAVAMQDNGVAWQSLQVGVIDAQALDYLRSLERDDRSVASSPLALTSLRAHLALSILLV